MCIPAVAFCCQLSFVFPFRFGLNCEYIGMDLNGMEWNGMEWNGMKEWNGMEWNGME